MEREKQFLYKTETYGEVWVRLVLGAISTLVTETKRGNDIRECDGDMNRSLRNYGDKHK